jgi:hypothetical protein
MENKEDLIESLFEKFETYLQTSIELYKLRALDKLAEITSTLASSLAIILIGIFFFLLFNIGIALWLGEMLGKSYYGFMLISGFYLLVGLLIYIFRGKWIKEKVSDSVIEQLLK